MKSKTYYIALNTCRESLRSKLLYSVLIFAALLVIISAFFGTVTIGDQIKVIKNFGLFSISLFSVLFAVLSGAALLYKELSRKTVYNILSKSVERSEFIMGKYFGMLATVALLLTGMGAGLSLFVLLLDGKLDLLLPIACLHIFFELMIVCAAAIFFSSLVVTPMLSGMFTFGLFLAGRSCEYVLYFVRQEHVSGSTAALLQGLYWMLPHLDKLNISDLTVYGQSIPPEQTLLALIYSASYAGVLLVFATLIFDKREFN
jgi:Cu-processing system permease protein